MEKVFASIRSALASLRESSRQVAVFGSDLHGFQLNPTLTEEAVCAFERTHGILLPAEYRGFLLHVGNGGAGPAYGLFKLGEMDDGHEHKEWWEGNGFVGVLSSPFPHSEPWNDLSGQPDDPERDLAEDPEYEEEYNQWEECYWNPENVNGAIPICHLGCAYRLWLVITGSEAGNIWCDDRADQGGLWPLDQAGRHRVSFLQWYLAWLEDALAQLRGHAQAES